MDTGFSFADVYDEVVSRAGGEQTTAEDVARVRRGLRLLLERWEAKGYNTWRHRSTEILTPKGLDRVLLDREVDDIIHVTRGGGGALERIPLDQMYALDQRHSSGTPGSYAVVRTEPPTLLLYPWGAETTLKIWYVARPADYRRGADNMNDVPGRWLEAMILGLAHDFSRKRPPYDEGLIARLKGEAGEAELTALRADRDRARYRFRTKC